MLQCVDGVAVPILHGSHRVGFDLAPAIPLGCLGLFLLDLMVQLLEVARGRYRHPFSAARASLLAPTKQDGHLRRRRQCAEPFFVDVIHTKAGESKVLRKIKVNLFQKQFTQAQQALADERSTRKRFRSTRTTLVCVPCVRCGHTHNHFDPPNPADSSPNQNSKVVTVAKDLQERVLRTFSFLR